jgi:cation transport ATPase
LFAAVASLGYQPRPFTADAVHRLQEREHRTLLIRFGTALFLSMQLMGYSLALYAGYFQGMEPGAKQLLQWFAAAVATPVVFYSGWPFLAGAWRSLRNRAANMDLLIALGVLAAYAASIHALFFAGEVYFDTAAMIITLILAGRLFENSARRRAAAGIDRLLTAGTLAAASAEAFGPGAVHHASVEELAARVAAELGRAGAGVTVLVKGSRFMRMERVVAALCGEPAAAGAH